MEPIDYNGTPTLSFRQVDSMNGFTKGTTFRLFKRAGDALQEGRDFFYLPASEYSEWIGTLRAAGRIYPSSRHLVLLTREGYERLQDLSSTSNNR
ncbi:ORF6N domain-containing protein [Halospina denitrificans]|uniref:ORF6N domain-containing protein n=1 Tax=Halospina denitrificans TaxID=332522 RepID=A0A4R7JTS6_9GAMM|nr:ORF6N domain-containing protein [Halospina denitrificans]TDT41742.1 ORF6N domain-containing protein [Halospina denitrificans]